MTRFAFRLGTLFVAATLAACAHVDADPAPLYAPPPGAIVLRIEVLAVEPTRWTAGCGDDVDCVPHDAWFTYQARVREVVSGEWAAPGVLFGHLQHTRYIHQVVDDCYVVLVPAADSVRGNVRVDLVADRILSDFWQHHRDDIRALRRGGAAR